MVLILEPIVITGTQLDIDPVIGLPRLPASDNVSAVHDKVVTSAKAKIKNSHPDSRLLKKRIIPLLRTENTL